MMILLCPSLGGLGSMCDGGRVLVIGYIYHGRVRFNDHQACGAPAIHPVVGGEMIHMCTYYN